MTTVFHARINSKFIEIKSNLKRKKFHKMNQGSNFLGASFTETMKQPLSNLEETGRKRSLKNYFFMKRFIHFHINISRFIRTIYKKTEFSTIKTWKLFLAFSFFYAFFCFLFGHIQIQKPTLDLCSHLEVKVVLRV